MSPRDSSSWSQTDYDEREEFARNVKVSLLGVTPSTICGSFIPRGKSTVSSDWEDWCEGIFETIIGPSFTQAFQLGQRMQLREIVAFDRELVDSLGDKVSASLINAARPFMEGKEEMRGNREWIKYVEKVRADEAPGHLPILFALHSILFRMPMASALQSYAWFEWKMGHASIDISRSAGIPEAPPQEFLRVRQSIDQVLCSGENSDCDGRPKLKVI